MKNAPPPKKKQAPLTPLAPLLSPKERETIKKRLKNLPLTQTESNYLSRSIRPKLRAAKLATEQNLLEKIQYKRKKYQRNLSTLKEKILKAVPKNLHKELRAIILYGSYLTTNATNYNDIDLLVILKKPLWKNLKEKYLLKEHIESLSDLPLDINLITERSLKEQLLYNPWLQLIKQNHSILHGNITLPNKQSINKAYLYGRLGETEAIADLGTKAEPKDLYQALRTCIAIHLLLKKSLKNEHVDNEIRKQIGEETVNQLKKNTIDNIKKSTMVHYLKRIYKNLERSLLYE